MNMWSVTPDTLLLPPCPARSYGAALERAEALQARDGAEVHPACASRLLTHGARVDRAVVMLHGYTNCPYEVVRLGEVLFEGGANVLIPRLPHHGIRDRMTEDLQNLTLAEQVRSAAEAIDIACGLGHHVTVAGLCSGGVLAAWAAQFRADVARAVVIAPSLMAARIPLWLAPGTMLVLDRMPNQFWWWNRHLKARLGHHSYAYPRFSTHALGEIFRLSLSIVRAARHTPPAARSIVVVSNDADPVVNWAEISRLIVAWQAHGAAVETYTFPASLHLPHDLIDPHHPLNKMAVVYPILVQLIEGVSRPADALNGGAR